MSRPEPLPCGWQPRPPLLAEKVLARATELAKENPTWRAGQTFANALQDVAPDVARRLAGTAADPFYDDGRIDAFTDAIIAVDAPTPS